MEKHIVKWKEKPILYKSLSALVIFCSALIVVLALLQLLGVWENAMFAYMPLVSVNMSVVAFLNWKTNRSTALVSLSAALVTIICTIVIAFVK